MQKAVLKFVLFITVILTGSPLWAQNTSSDWRMADSLYRSKKYTQSLAQYEKIFHQGKYSASMLLKMAFIHEGLGQPDKSLYFLNLYHQLTHDSDVDRKMTELAEARNLHGYDNSSDWPWISMAYKRYYHIISLGLGALCLILLCISFYTSFKLKQKPIASAVCTTFFLLVLAAHINMGKAVTFAMTTKPQTYIMSEPSSGADIIDNTQVGDRLLIIGQKDVWLKIAWEGKIGYVKNHHTSSLAL